ncbi:MAG TPA: PRC-barrel domain-containing protein, partial [Desulfosarcina sp.]|nr:PRC-barrel domain-containing protein [Desulfosarcina sp.]
MHRSSSVGVLQAKRSAIAAQALRSACLLAILLCAGAVRAAEQGEETLLASRIIDRDVYVQGDKLVGEVDDLVVRRNGRVKKLTVEFGGFMDLGDKLVALPFTSLRMQNGRATLDATEKQLDQKKYFDYSEENLRPDYYYRRTPHSAYAVTNPRPDYYYEEGPYRMDPADKPPFFRAPPRLLPGWSYSPSRFLASSIMDRRLINQRGEEIGRVKDLVIDGGSHKVSKIIIASEDILGKTVHVALDYKPPGFRYDGIVYELA